MTSYVSVTTDLKCQPFTDLKSYILYHRPFKNKLTIFWTLSQMRCNLSITFFLDMCVFKRPHVQHTSLYELPLVTQWNHKGLAPPKHCHYTHRHIVSRPHFQEAKIVLVTGCTFEGCTHSARRC